MPTKTVSIKTIIALLAILVLVGVSAGQTYWHKTYGGSLDDVGNAITPTSDGNFIVAGMTSSFGAGRGVVYLLKIKPDGDTIWTRTYGGVYNDWANAITPTPDGNFIAVGSHDPSGSGFNDVYFLKIKPNGDTIWTKTYPGGNMDAAYAVAPTADGNFIIAGMALNSNFDDYLLKIKPDGDTVWTKMYGGPITDNARAITPTTDGNFFIAGASTSFNANLCEAYLLKIKPDGDTVWTKTYGSDNAIWAHTIIPTTDENFIIAGFSSPLYSIYCFGYLLKIKPNGDTIWTKTFEALNRSDKYAIIQTTDRNFIIAGCTFSSGASDCDIYLLKITPNGDQIWSKRYGGVSNDYAYAIAPTADGNFIVTGSLGGDLLLLSVIDDRYAKKGSLFTFKIPVAGDSLSYGYKAIDVPAGMTVSQGGTISWTPTTDSSYMEHVEFYVVNDFGTGDSLDFNIFVNTDGVPTRAISPSARNTTTHPSSDLTPNIISSSLVYFSLPATSSSLQIYDIHGRRIKTTPASNGKALWQGTDEYGNRVTCGRYIALVTDGKRSLAKPFMIVR